MTPRSLLLVEDNIGDEALTLRALKRSGVSNDVAVVRDGAEALDYLFCRGNHANRHPAGIPALMILDLNLPKIGGLDVLKRVRADERTKSMPVVILTSSGEEKDLIAGYLSGANSYVRKPVEFAEFVNAVQQLGLYWLILNEPPPSIGAQHKNLP